MQSPADRGAIGGDRRAIEDLKKQVRSEVLAVLRVTTVAERALWSERVCSALASIVPRVSTLALFRPTEFEPRVWPSLATCAERMCFPRTLLVGRAMEFIEGDGQRFVRSAFGIEEPATGRVIEPAEIDAIVVPALALGGDGSRLGYGQGYYDRYLARLRDDVPRIGVCFALQFRDTLPTLSHDVRLTHVVTESQVIIVAG